MKSFVSTIIFALGLYQANAFNFDTELAGTKTKTHSCGCSKPATETREKILAMSEANEARAVCVLKPAPGEVATGVVFFEQTNMNSFVTYEGLIWNLTPGKEQGFHVHELGDMTDGCESLGSHYNPFGNDHGGPDDQNRHIGDLGNVQVDDQGTASFKKTDELLELSGPFSIIGRSCIIHAGTDDLGKGGDEESLTTGNAGDRIGCGVIGLTNMNMEEYLAWLENPDAEEE